MYAWHVEGPGLVCLLTQGSAVCFSHGHRKLVLVEIRAWGTLHDLGHPAETETTQACLIIFNQRLWHISSSVIRAVYISVMQQGVDGECACSPLLSFRGNSKHGHLSNQQAAPWSQNYADSRKRKKISSIKTPQKTRNGLYRTVCSCGWSYHVWALKYREIH